jgi:hypothetical protein
MNKKMLDFFTAVKKNLALFVLLTLMVTAFYIALHNDQVYATMRKTANNLDGFPSIDSMLYAQTAVNMCLEQTPREDVYFVSCGGFF